MNYLITASICFFEILLFSNLIAQQNHKDSLIQLSGQILRNSNKSPLADVHIMIKNKGKGTISDEDGLFSINTDKNDTIIFSSIGFRRETYSIKENIEHNEYFTIVFLTQDTLILNEVNIIINGSWKKFKQEFMKLDIESTEQRKINLSGVIQYEGPYKPIQPTISNPITLLYYNYNKKERLLRKLEKIRKNSERRVSEIIEMDR